MSRTDVPNFDFEISKGHDNTVVFRYRADGAPVDLTGQVVSLVCTDASLNQNAVYKKSPKSGELTFEFSAALTDVLLSRNLKYQLIIYPEGETGKSKLLLTGKIRILQGL